MLLKINLKKKKKITITDHLKKAIKTILKQEVNNDLNKKPCNINIL